MCPMCMTTAAFVTASAASGVGVIGLIALKLRAVRRRFATDEKTRSAK